MQIIGYLCARNNDDGDMPSEALYVLFRRTNYMKLIF